MDSKKVFERFGQYGFIKTSSPAPMNSQQKALLNRKGNQLFNQGNIEEARRIFVTTGYSDGLARVGDYYLKEGRPVDALKMYWIAPDKTKMEGVLIRMASLIQKLMHEDEVNEQ